MTLPTPTYLGALWREGLALADAAERAGLGAEVPPCPGWTVADLVAHAGDTLHFFTWVVEQASTDLVGYEPEARPDDGALVARLRGHVHHAVEVLTAADPTTEVWSWAPAGRSVAWVARRLAQEEAVHRWDAESAAGDPPAIDTELAIDGVDEFLEHFSGHVAEDAAPLGGSVHLHTTDGDGEWLITEPSPTGPLAFAHEHAKGDVAVRATASDLLLALWRRKPLDGAGFQVFGDEAVAHRLVARTAMF